MATAAQWQSVTKLNNPFEKQDTIGTIKTDHTHVELFRVYNVFTYSTHVLRNDACEKHANMLLKKATNGKMVPTGLGKCPYCK